MSLGEIVKTALIDTALGMGTVFVILVIISIVIWALGRTVGEANPKKITANTFFSIPNINHIKYGNNKTKQGSPSPAKGT